MSRPTLDDLRKASQSIKATDSQRQEAIALMHELVVEIMSLPPGERGATTYAIAEAVGLSRQQLHQIYRDKTGKIAEPDTVGG